MKRGKRHVEAARLVSHATLYDATGAVALVEKAVVVKSDETTEAHLRTERDGHHTDRQIRGTVVLSYGIGRVTGILVFAGRPKTDEAQATGTDFIGGEELIPKIQSEGWLGFDVVVATPDMMDVIERLGRVLGPKGLIPNPEAGTVTMDVTKAISDIKANRIEYRLDKINITHAPLGRASFIEEQLTDNFQTLMDAVTKAELNTLRGVYIRSVTLSSTMGPDVKLNVGKLVNQV